MSSTLDQSKESIPLDFIEIQEQNINEPSVTAETQILELKKRLGLRDSTDYQNSHSSSKLRYSAVEFILDSDK